MSSDKHPFQLGEAFGRCDRVNNQLFQALFIIALTPVFDLKVPESALTAQRLIRDGSGSVWYPVRLAGSRKIHVYLLSTTGL